MSCIIVAAPVIIAGWPVITAAVTAAVASMGFNIVATKTSQRQQNAVETKNKVDIELDDSEILQDSVLGQQIIVERQGIRAIFSRDARGALRLCIEGDTHSKEELKRIGQELVDRVTQQYVYHRVVSELKERHMTIVDEEISADRTVKIRVRNI